MKKNLFLTGLLLTVLTAGAQNANLKGTFLKDVMGHKSNMLYIAQNEKGQLAPKTAAALRSTDRSFQVNVTPDMGIIGKVNYVGADGEFYPLYIKQGETIDFTVKDGTIRFNGKLSKENKFFAAWYSLLAPLRQLDYTPLGRSTGSQRYHELIDSITPLAEQLIAKVNTGNSYFDNWVKKAMPYNLQYDVLNVFSNGIEFGQKTDYPAYLQKLFNNYQYDSMDVWNYSAAPFDLISIYTFGRAWVYNFIVGPTLPISLTYISDPQLRGEVMIEAMNRQLLDSCDVRCKQYESSFVTADQKARRDMLLRRWMVNQPGNPAIDFAYEDVNGQKKSLSDYKGKVVVVDVWATWCAPCKKEIPMLEQLQKEFQGQDVVFMSVSFDTDRAAWKKMISEKHMGGVQLISYRKGPLVDDYVIDAVPRFMVFDRQGNVVTTNASRPSEPELKQLIETELKKN